MVKAVFVLVLLGAVPVYAQNTPIADAVRAISVEMSVPPQDTGSSKNSHAKAGTALLIASVTFSGVATAYTVLCETADICREVNPFMVRLIGKGMTRAIVVKASVNAGVHYLVWRYAPEGKWRTAILGVLAGINGADAINDGRVVRRALRERGR